MIYVVEDDPGIRELECYALKQAGFEVCGFEEGGAFWAAVRAHLPQLVLLDVMLPGEDGNQLLMRLKQDPRTRSVPVIMVTARGEEMDKVQSLDGGADDYIVKPFGVMELLSRVRAVLRRAGKEQPGELAAGGLRMDVERHRVYADGRDVTLTHMEFELLHYLLLNRGRPISQEELIEHVWDSSVDSFSNSIRVHISALRKKLRAVLGYDPIRNRIGEGYEIGGEVQ